MYLKTIFFLLFFSLFGAAREFEFCSSYETCEASFLKAIETFRFSLPENEKSKLEVGSWLVPSQTYDDLRINYAYLPAQESPEGLAIITSGVHGVEGLIGNAFHRLFIEEVLPTIDRKKVGFFLIHTMNPFGLRTLRRVTENNVDLNRNFGVFKDFFGQKNEGYKQLNSLLNPTTRPNVGFFEQLVFYVRATGFLLKGKLRSLREDILKGQYENSKGIYFGGFNFEPHRGFIEKAFLERATSYSKILLFDVHSGFGKKGTMHLMPSSTTTDNPDLINRIFEGYPLLTPDADSYQATGDFVDFGTHLLKSQGKAVVPMVLEFGTFSNQGHLGGLDSLERMILENQMFHYKAKNSRSEREIKRKFVELFYPQDESWRKSVINSVKTDVATLVHRFASECTQTLLEKK